MFHGDRAAVRGGTDAVCLVVGDGLTGDGGAYCHQRAQALAEQGWKVHVLDCGPARAGARADLERPARGRSTGGPPVGCPKSPQAGRPCYGPVPAALKGVRISRLAETEAPAPLRLRGLLDSPCADRSDRVSHCLEELHRKHRFALVEFPARGGLGFRAIQARRAGLAFQDVRFVVRFDGCSALLREQEHAWVQGAVELERDYCERYAFEQADAQTAANPALLDEARRLGWDVRPSSSPSPLAGEGGGGGDCIAGEAPLVTVSIAHYNLGRYLPETLASLAAQTYPHIEVLVIDDGSTDAESITVLRQMQARYPQFRFLTQANAGIGATRNRGLREARGEFFLPMDADNVARPDMVERFVAGMRRNPGTSALTCYFLAFTETADLPRERYAYAYRPTGGPFVLASMRNVYGDANALFRTADFRAVGGYETDRDTSCEDWEAFVKLAAAGYRLDVVPDYLFFYRHREAGFSRVTDGYRNHQRVLRQFLRTERLPPAERALLWNALPGMQRRLEQLEEENRVLRRRWRSWRGLISRLLRAVGRAKAEEGACLPA